MAGGRISKNEEVSPGKKIREMKENRNADSPNPEKTRPTVVARCFTSGSARANGKEKKVNLQLCLEMTLLSN